LLLYFFDECALDEIHHRAVINDFVDEIRRVEFFAFFGLLIR
jgi:hypothetical protein